MGVGELHGRQPYRSIAASWLMNPSNVNARTPSVPVRVIGAVASSDGRVSSPPVIEIVSAIAADTTASQTTIMYAMSLQVCLTFSSCFSDEVIHRIVLDS